VREPLEVTTVAVPVSPWGSTRGLSSSNDEYGLIAATLPSLKKVQW